VSDTTPDQPDNLIECDTFGLGIAFTEEGDVTVLLTLGESGVLTHALGFKVREEGAYAFAHHFHNRVIEAEEMQEEIDCCPTIEAKLSKIMEIRERSASASN
jgi:hypothetical protein